MAGSEFRMPCTSFFMLGIELIVRRGLRTRITRIAEKLLEVTTVPTQPMITTTKSSYNRLEEAYYDVPRVTKIGVWFEEEPKCYDLEDHFGCVDDLEDQV